MEINESAKKLLDAFYAWLEASSKVSYKFSYEEQRCLEQMIATMNNQINALIDYELKNK